MADAQNNENEGNLVYLVGLLAGGLTLGFGIRSYYWSFGWEKDCLNCDFAGVGFSGIDNLGLLPAGYYSIGMVIAGVVVLVALNGFAWRYTNGY